MPGESKFERQPEKPIPPTNQPEKELPLLPPDQRVSQAISQLRLPIDELHRLTGWQRDGSFSSFNGLLEKRAFSLPSVSDDGEVKLTDAMTEFLTKAVQTSEQFTHFARLASKVPHDQQARFYIMLLCRDSTERQQLLNRVREEAERRAAKSQPPSTEKPATPSGVKREAPPRGGQAEARGEVVLTPEEAVTARYAQEYANLSERDLKMTPELWQQLREFRRRGAFEFQGYGEFEWMHPIIDPRNKFHEMKLPVGGAMRDLLPRLDTIDRGGTVARYKEAKGVVEALVFMPLQRQRKVVDEAAKPGGLFRRATPEKSHTIDEVVPYNAVLEGATSPEGTMRITYDVSDKQLYRTNLVHAPKTEKHKFNRAGITFYVTPDNYQERLADVRSMKNATRQHFTGDEPTYEGRDGNRVVVSVLLPKSEAEQLWHYFSEHPEHIRPFFTLGAAPLHIGHVPPPYDVWDKKSYPMLMRRYQDGHKEKYDEFLKQVPKR